MKKLFLSIIFIFVISPLVICQPVMEWEIVGTGNFNGFDGYYQKLYMDGSFHEDDFLFEEDGYIRNYAFMMSWQTEWTLLPENTYWVKENNLEIGDSWTSWFNVATTTHVTDTGTIQTPAGTFFSYKTEFYAQSAPDSLIGIIWFSNGIGWVQFGTADTLNIQLVEYTIAGGSGFYPLEVGNYWKFAPVNTLIHTNEKKQSDYPVELLQNCPNPFKSSTNIQFVLLEYGPVQVDIFNSTGKHIINIYKGRLSPDSYNFDWNANNQLPGLYLCRLKFQDYILTKKLFLLK